MPSFLVKFIPGIRQFCGKEGLDAVCAAGAVHHHFEMTFPVLPIQLHSIPLALFASVVAPFGGFLASGIKRAYNIKDFDSIIPGHGGKLKNERGKAEEDWTGEEMRGEERDREIDG